jgi:hypothetical protein
MLPTEAITCGGVGISAEAFWQIERKRKVFEIKRENLVTCELHYGSPEERPLVSLILGLVLMSPGFWLIGVFISGEAHVGLRSLRYELAMLVFFGLGLWLVYQSVATRAYYLLVTKDGAARKLVFKKNTETGAIHHFLEEAKSRFGLPFSDRLPEAKRVDQPNHATEPTTPADTSAAEHPPRQP